MQFLILCWAVCLNALTGSRRSVLRSGGGLPSNTNQNQVNFRAARLMYSASNSVFHADYRLLTLGQTRSASNLTASKSPAISLGIKWCTVFVKSMTMANVTM